MKAKIITLVLLLTAVNAMGQGIVRRQKQNTTPQPVTPKVTPKPKPKTVVSKQQPEAAGYDVSFSCNVSSAELYVDGIPSGTASGTRFLKTGYHYIKVTADGYKDYTEGITVNKSNKSFYFSMSKVENPATLYSKGEEYYNKKDYAQAVKYFRQAADMGHAASQCYLGFCYKMGYGVTKDSSEAMKWYRKAADQGYAVAQFNIGCNYHDEKNYTEAVKWYRKAAEQGNTGAQLNLGHCYLYGNGVTKDYYEAVKWIRKAVDKGNANAQSNLGYCYENGYGVTKSRDEAIKYYRMAARQGNTYALDQLRRLGITTL